MGKLFNDTSKHYNFSEIKEKAKIKILLIAYERSRTSTDVTHHFSRNNLFAVVRTPHWEAFTCFKMILKVKRNKYLSNLEISPAYRDYLLSPLHVADI